VAKPELQTASSPCVRGRCQSCEANQAVGTHSHGSRSAVRSTRRLDTYPHARRIGRDLRRRICLGRRGFGPGTLPVRPKLAAGTGLGLSGCPGLDGWHPTHPPEVLPPSAPGLVPRMSGARRLAPYPSARSFAAASTGSGSADVRGSTPGTLPIRPKFCRRHRAWSHWMSGARRLTPYPFARSFAAGTGAWSQRMSGARRLAPYPSARRLGHSKP
jgi:hypothetical protein